MSELLYVDTSVLAKRYLRESDSSQAIALLDGVRIVTSAITELELVSAIFAASRAKMVTKDDAQDVSARIDEDRLRWNVLEITSTTLRRAREIIAKHPLRCADAIHCASAWIFQEEYGSPIAFATQDKKQAKVVAALGFPLAGGTKPLVTTRARPTEDETFGAGKRV